jgi:hypothetical protein
VGRSTTPLNQPSIIANSPPTLKLDDPNINLCSPINNPINIHISSTVNNQNNIQNNSSKSSRSVTPIISGKIHKRNRSLHTTSVNINTEVKTNEILKKQKKFVTDIENLPQLKPQSDPVQKYLQESLKIIDKIRLNFQISTENNRIELLEEENRKFKEILKNKYKNVALNEIHYLTTEDKKRIQHNIIVSSDQRMKNYSGLFNIINTALCEMKDLLKDYNKRHHKSVSIDSIDVNYNSPSASASASASYFSSSGNFIFILSDKKKKDKRDSFLRYSLNEQEMDKIKTRLEMPVIEENTVEMDNIEGDNYIITSDEEEDEDLSSEDSCDFSESLMLENALVLLPKLTSTHHLNSLQIKELIRRESKKQKFNLSKGKSKKLYSNLRKVDQIKEEDDHKNSAIIEFDKLAEIYKDNALLENEDTNNASTNVYEPTIEANLNKKDSNCLLF